tara:strand:+ start:137 stop:505 length:369 start_codon:yes stop_codon:yes gene_type:complete
MRKFTDCDNLNNDENTVLIKILCKNSLLIKYFYTESLINKYLEKYKNNYDNTSKKKIKIILKYLYNLLNNLIILIDTEYFIDKTENNDSIIKNKKSDYYSILNKIIYEFKLKIKNDINYILF